MSNALTLDQKFVIQIMLILVDSLSFHVMLKIVKKVLVICVMLAKIQKLLVMLPNLVQNMRVINY